MTNPAEDHFRKVAPLYMDLFMTDFAASDLDAAAVFGNGGHESLGFTKLQEIKPTVKGSRGGFGWFQWTGPRRHEFEAYCKRNSLDPTSDIANYKFMYTELKGSEKGAITKLKAAKSLEEKVVAFEMGYERAGVKHYPARQKWAKIALDALKSAGPSVIKPDTVTVHEPVGPAVSVPTVPPQGNGRLYIVLGSIVAAIIAGVIKFFGG